jgi:hypothetical protein
MGGKGKDFFGEENKTKISNPRRNFVKFLPPFPFFSYIYNTNNICK